MDPRREAVPAEDPEAEERRLQEEGGQALDRERRAEHVAHELRVDRPVHPELELLHQPGGDADREVDQEERPEEVREAQPALVPRPVPLRLHDRDERPEAERQRHEQEVVQRGRRELNPREVDRAYGQNAHACSSPDRLLPAALALAISCFPWWDPDRGIVRPGGRWLHRPVGMNSVRRDVHPNRTTDSPRPGRTVANGKVGVLQIHGRRAMTRSGLMTDAGIDRSKLPIRRPPFAGATGRTLADSEPDWSQASHVQPPDGAPNVLLVLIDDAGFGNPSTFGGPIQTPNYTPARGQRAALQPLPRHGALLADQGRAADGAQPPPRRLRHGRRVLRARSRATTRPSRTIARRFRASSRRTAT